MSSIILCSVLVAQRQTCENKPSVKQDKIKINLSKKIIDSGIFLTHLDSVYILSIFPRCPYEFIFWWSDKHREDFIQCFLIKFGNPFLLNCPLNIWLMYYLFISFKPLKWIMWFLFLAVGWSPFRWWDWTGSESCTLSRWMGYWPMKWYLFYFQKDFQANILCVNFTWNFLYC